VDTPLKQRLIGAIVLVALAVIFLPMLVKGPAPDSGVQDVPLRAPDAPADGQFETRELPLVAPNAPAAGSATGMPAAQPVAEAAPPADTGSGALPPTAAAGNYAVNFGAYATEADADAVIAHLKKSNLPGFRQQDTINGRPAWRVRIGPYADRAQAELVRLEAGKVRNDVNAQVVVLDAGKEPAAAPVAAQAAPAPAPATATPPVRTEALPAEPARPVAAAPKPEAPRPAAPKPAAPERTTPATSTAPAASKVGFAVQLGAFGQPADANALRDRVRAAGFSAFVEQVRRGDGVLLHRVRVGPVANRADAEQLKAQVAAKVGIAGIVSPHP